MKNYNGFKRGFYHTGAQYYAQGDMLKLLMGRDEVDEIMIGMYHDDGGTAGEFAIT